MNKTSRSVALRAALFGAAALSLMQAAAAGDRPQLPLIDWDDTLTFFQIDKDEFLGQRISVRCPARGPNEPAPALFGSAVYPSDSAICVAALHEGRIGADGGEVTVQLNPGAASYDGADRNEVKSAARPATARSIVFISGADTEADAIRAKYRPVLDWEDRFTQTGLAYRDLVGQRFAFICPPAPEPMLARRIVGTDRYAFATPVCQAAVHAGALTRNGGEVVVQLDPQDRALVGSIRNGIETFNGPSGERSLTFIAAAAND